MKISIIGLMAVLSRLSAIAGTISIQPSNLTVPLGQNVSLNVNALSVTDVYALQFDLTFNPGLLSATGITEGSFLTAGGATSFVPGSIDNIGGTVSFTADTLVGAMPGVNGNGTLATLQFKALSAGTSPITISNVILLNSGLSIVTAATANGAVTIQGPTTGVPEPGTWFLLTVPLCAMALSQTRRGRSRLWNSG